MKTTRLLTTFVLSLILTLSLLWMLSNHVSLPALAQSGTGTIRVATTGTNTAGCGSVAAPCRTVQYAVNLGVVGDQILVATGTYTDPAGTVIALNKTVTVQGGWNGAFTAHDPALYPTTLDARRLGSVISITGQSGAVISPTVDGFIITRGDASSQEIKGGGLYSIYANPIVVNNVFTNNVANSIHYYTGDGGGLYLSQSPGVAVIRNNVFISNTAAITGGWGQGGAIFSEYSSPLIVGNVITGNFANGFIARDGVQSSGGNGGGIVAHYGMTATTVISGNQLYNNVSSVGEHGTGGGMSLGDGAMLIQNNTVRGNTACSNGYGSGGGIMLSASRGPVTITGNLLGNNFAGLGANYNSRGGGLFFEYLLEPGQVLIQGNTIVSNTAGTASSGEGGGVYLQSVAGAMSIGGNQILSNTASAGGVGSGGGIFLRDGAGALSISGNQILSNTASTSREAFGGGVYIYSYQGAAIVQDNHILSNTASTANWGIGGGVLVFNSNSVTVTRNLIQGNAASTFPVYDSGNPPPPGAGGGIGVDSSTLLIHDNTIRNNVAATHLEGQGGGIYARYGGAVTIESNLIDRNVSAFNAPFSYGGGIFLQETNPVVRRNTIRDNRSSNAGGCGGGVFTWLSGATLDANTILSNTAVVSVTESNLACGGGMALYYSTGVSMTNNIVARNRAAIQGTSQGGGIWTRGLASDAYRTEMDMLHNTVADNTGEGIYLGRYTVVTLTNNIVANHTVGITNAAPASSTVRANYTLFNGNNPNYGSGVTSTNEILGSPAFVNPAGGNYHIGSTSAARDAGVNAGVTRDIDGDPRPLGPGYDIGADEIGLALSKTAPGTATTGKPITYTLIVTNTNLFALTNVVVSDTVPAGAYYVSGGSYAGGNVTWTIPSIAPSSGVAQVSFIVTATATITNSRYRVMTSTQGVSTGFGPPVVTVVNAPPCNALTNVGVAGPLTGTLGSAYAFIATANPPASTLPITYVWRATAQTPVTSTVNSITNVVQFTWNVTGTQTVTVTAANACSIPVSDTHAIVVEAAPIGCQNPLTSLGISGPGTGYTGTLYTFTTAITPNNATQPITYTWSPEPISGQGTASASYQWAAPGVYTFTVAAKNCGGVVSATHTITIAAESQYLYLPLVMREYASAGQIQRGDGTRSDAKPTPMRLPWQSVVPPVPPQKLGLP